MVISMHYMSIKQLPGALCAYINVNHVAVTLGHTPVGDSQTPCSALNSMFAHNQALHSERIVYKM